MVAVAVPLPLPVMARAVPDMTGFRHNDETRALIMPRHKLFYQEDVSSMQINDALARYDTVEVSHCNVRLYGDFIGKHRPFKSETTTGGTLEFVMKNCAIVDYTPNGQGITLSGVNGWYVSNCVIYSHVYLHPGARVQ